MKYTTFVILAHIMRVWITDSNPVRRLCSNYNPFCRCPQYNNGCYECPASCSFGSIGTSTSTGTGFTTGSSETTSSYGSGDHNRPYNNMNGCPPLTVSPTLKTECHIDRFGCFVCDASVVTTTPTTNPVHTTTDITTTTATLTQTAISITSISTSPTTANKTTTHTTTLTTTVPTTATAPTVASSTACPPFPSDCPDIRGCIDVDANLCSVCLCAGGNMTTLSPGCRPLECLLDCGNPLTYKKDETGCDVCQCDISS
ncbi:uncharacterized protein LOC127867100 [Dreissena polymorpha]|uniref:uncharacterized protein LOC127867100 n=1 Tax=Dreissena polymorpha TaxID=45954 RepID=UPI002263DE4D|nr:uncharacterized protein LOC127867100 [Dreissena polymorpha]